MRSILFAALLFSVVAHVSAGEPVSQAVDIKPTVTRGVQFLVKDALAWKSEHNCISCHHAALAVWSIQEAKQRGYAVDDAVLDELTTWSATTVGPGTTGVPRPAAVPKAANLKSVYFAQALGAVTQPNADVQKAMPALIETLATDQVEDGSWKWWPETRPPIFGSSDESVTVLSTLAVVAPAAAGDAKAVAVRDKGMAWLAAHPTDGDPQTVAMRLVLWKRLDRPFDEWHPLAQRILQKQNGDGGWSQAAEMSSDAWATGQALYALGHAGIKASDPAVARARAFLVKTQREDGAWPMTSRPIKPGGEGSKSLVPITGAGAAWAILGLVRSN